MGLLPLPAETFLVFFRACSPSRNHVSEQRVSDAGDPPPPNWDADGFYHVVRSPTGERQTGNCYYGLRLTPEEADVCRLTDAGRRFQGEERAHGAVLLTGNRVHFLLPMERVIEAPDRVQRPADFSAVTFV